jgi:predicted ArsR family transcriptional regulator
VLDEENPSSWTPIVDSKRPQIALEANLKPVTPSSRPRRRDWLASLLSDAIRRQQDPRQVGRQDGHHRGAEIAGTGDRLDLLEAEMARRGFRPTRVERGRRVDFVFGRCPFAEVAQVDPDTVCQLHLGMAEGLTEGLGGLAVEKLVAKDPRRAGCRLTVRQATPGTGPPA